MTSYVALLRGINVGGHNKLPMQDLRDILAALGCKDIKTYIQSGNAVFRSDDYQSILSANPFPDAVDNPKSLHVSFLSENPAEPDLTALDALKSSTENYALLENAFYLYAPDGIGRSKLATAIAD